MDDGAAEPGALEPAGEDDSIGSAAEVPSTDKPSDAPRGADRANHQPDLPEPGSPTDSDPAGGDEESGDSDGDSDGGGDADGGHDSGSDGDPGSDGDSEDDGGDSGGGGGEPPAVHRISGRLRFEQAGVAGAALMTDDGGSACVSDSAGYFELEVPRGWSGKVTPQHDDYHFDPRERSFADVTCDLDDESFDAQRKPTLTPSFAVRKSDGNLRTYPGNQTIESDQVVTFDDAYISAELSYLGEDEWELRVTAKQPLKGVWFPFDIEPEFLNGDAADDVYLVPYVFGTAIKADAAPDFEWNGPLYPGKAFTPLVVHADGANARMFAAANWPPRPVKTLYQYGRIGLNYSEQQYGIIPAGETRAYRALMVQASGYPDLGIAAWRRATDRYKSWLQARMSAEGLYPSAQPDWVCGANGWVNVAVSDKLYFDGAEMRAFWNRWKHILPWLQIWGQMSGHDPHGCCLPRMEMHERYVPDLVELAQDIVQEGRHVGFYSRPEFIGGIIDGLDAESQASLQFVLDWIDVNMVQYSANAVYIDLVGAHYYGDPLTVAQLFQTAFPPGTVIEYSVDVYPAVFLVSGALFAYGNFGGGAEYTDRLDAFDETWARVTFPRFGRHILDDRVLFLGCANHDYVGWGAENEFWGERQVFLMGAKFDAQILTEPDDPYTLDPAIELAIAEWDRVGWWSRAPVYRDRAGIYDLPADLDVRRFVDGAGVSLFVIDNWHQHDGLSFGFEGQAVPIPAQSLSIVELP